MDGLVLRAEDIGALTPELLDRVAQGEAVAITREGAVVAQLVATAPASPFSAEELARRRALMERIKANRAELNRRGAALTHEDIRTMRDDHSA